MNKAYVMLSQFAIYLGDGVAWQQVTERLQFYIWTQPHTIAVVLFVANVR